MPIVIVLAHWVIEKLAYFKLPQALVPMREARL